VIGILCSKSKKIKYTKKFYSLIKNDNNCKIEPVIIFSNIDLDFNNNTVNGYLIRRNEITFETIPIPEIINNFLIPGKRASRRIIKMLAKRPDIMLVNEANRFRHHMIIEMLLSSEQTREFVLNGHKYNHTNGSNCNRCINKMLQMDEQFVFKLHAIRDCNNHWNVLPLPEAVPQIHQPLYYQSALKVAGCISNFIPSLAFCTAYFALDANGSPFLVNFAGWDSSLLLCKQNKESLSLFSEYFFGYNNLLLNSKRMINYVG